MNLDPRFFTGATQAMAIGCINALMGLAVAFNVPMTDAQQGAIIAVANTFMALFVVLTKENSPSRAGGSV